MRLLTKIKLVNWHFFVNETITIDNDTLVTGDNGTGKSTLIDALQVVMIGNLKKVRFNSSAMEDRTTRDVRSYLRGKTGAEGKSGYLRNEDFSSYIVLEITRTTNNQPYLIGVVFDYFQATGEEEHVFFRIDEEPVTDDLFFKAPQVTRNRGEFFDYLKARGIKHQQYRNDVNRYIQDLRQLFGGAKESFFSLFTKGISFSPITNLRSFVYDYILEERTLDVETMREYFEKFRQVEIMIEETKKEIAELENIEEIYREIEKFRETLQVNDYMVYRGAWETALGEAREKEEEQEKARRELKDLQEKIEETEKERRQLKEEIERLAEEMRRNEARQKEQELQRRLSELREKLEALDKRRKNLVHQIKVETEEINLLQEVLQQLEAPVELTRPLLESGEVWSRSAETEGGEFPPDIRVPAEAWSSGFEWLNRQRYQWEQEDRELEEEEKKLKETVRSLEKNQALGPESPTMKLKGVLEEHLFDARGCSVPVHVFCEAIDIKGERWRNAVEGYLHTQKFDLLVPPEYFDEALTLYERHKFSMGIDRVGLVNTARLLKESRKPEENSLAGEVEAHVEYVAAYANWLLGGVIKCETEQELKKNRRAITDTCMLYQNHTARQIPRRRYEVPYIGKEAIRTRLQQSRQRLEEVQRRRRDIKEWKETALRVGQLSTDKKDRYENWSREREELQERETLSEQVEQTQKELLSLDFSEYKKLESKHEQKQQELNQMDADLRKMENRKGNLESQVQNLEQQKEERHQESKERGRQLGRLEEELQENLLEKCRVKWDKEVKKQKPEVLWNNYRSNREGINTRMAKRQQGLVKVRAEYVHRYNFHGDPEAENNDAFRQRYRQLVDSHLQDYEEKAREAREQAEQSFQEHFIARLGEYIKMADEEIKELNRALKGMRFGSESYHFSLTPKKETRRYYDMITDTSVYQGSIFRDSFYQKYGEAINDLFREITARESEFQETMQSLTDYRTYLDFDIIITDELGNKSYFSKVARDKSGGETQVPFYVAILASFYQAYQLYRKTDTLRLVVFDEAFNRMDADRIEEAIRFMQNLGFQAVIVAPTGRIQLIVPHVNTNLVVMREGFNSFIERVTRKELVEG